MKKLFTLLFISSLLYSCSTDNNITEIEEETAIDINEQVASGKFDNSSLGVYEGVFTSLVSNNRSTVRIELDGKSAPIASFEFPDGEFKSFRAPSKVSRTQSSETIQFKGENFEFDFQVNADGSNPTVSNVEYMGEKGSMTVMKETSKAAVTPRTGTYSCVTGCGPHPDLGKGKTQTFNAILQTSTSTGTGASGEPTDGVADNSQANVVFQVVLAGVLFEMASSTPSMQQTSCEDRTRNVFIPGVGTVTYNTTRCQIDGFIQGGSGLADITGTHRYGRSTVFNSNTTDFNCSDYFGDFVYNSTWFGESVMTFQSDDNEGDNYCFATN